MGTKLAILISILWFPQALRQLFAWIYWLQVKEYRYDRFWIFIKTLDGRIKLLFYSIFLKSTLIIFSLLNPIFTYPLFLLFFFLDVIFLWEITTKRLRKPVFTDRVKKIILLCILFCIAIFLFVYFQNIFFILLSELTLLVSPLLGLTITAQVSERIKNQEILKAKKVLSLYKPKVIGITGSYGKTTTKDFIHQLLSIKYKVEKTQGSENTPFGIARSAYKFIKKETQFFVAEMGAYKKGEIKALCSIVSPSIGVITGIEPQHLALFGSLKNIMDTKFELIESLPEGGIAIFNLSNKYCRELFLRAKKLKTNLKVYGYGERIDGKKTKIDATVQVVSATHLGIKFKIEVFNERKTIFASVSGVHFVENLAAAILISRIFGVTWSDIKRACREIKLPKATMNLYRNTNGGVIIDDTYNTTPKGFEAALNYVSLFKNKTKLVVTPGIIELGEFSEMIHKKLGERMQKKSLKIIVTNKESFSAINSGITSEKLKAVFDDDPQSLIVKINVTYKEGGLILLEGRLPSEVMNFVKSYE